MHILKRTLKCAQLQLSQPLLFYIFKKERQTKTHKKMFDGSLLLEEHSTKWTKNTQKSPKQ